MVKSMLIVVAAATLVPFLASANPMERYPHPCDIAYPSDARIKWQCKTLPVGQSLESLVGDRWEDVARFNRIDRRHTRPGVAIKIPERIEDLEGFIPLPLFYPPAEWDDKFILIDLTEQFLVAYEYGALRFALPIVSGNERHETPTGEFHLTDAHRNHRSCLYKIEGTKRPYPMSYALKFYVDREGVSYWIHGRDLPGYPASHGCIGLYDEPMQKKEYGWPKEPMLSDAQRLFDWVLGGEFDDDRVIPLLHGPKIHIIGHAPRPKPLP
jgi:hypothetical protein